MNLVTFHEDCRAIETAYIEFQRDGQRQLMAVQGKREKEEYL